MLLISAGHLIAQDELNNPEWKPLYDSLIYHAQLPDGGKVDDFAEELFTSKKLQIHDSLRIYIGAIVADLKKNEQEAFRFLNLNEVKLSQSGKNKHLLAWNYYYKGAWYFHNFYDKKALTYFLKADSIFTAIDLKSFMSVMTKVGICDILMQSGFDQKPLVVDKIFAYVEEGLSVSDSLGYSVPSAILLYKKGDIYFAKGDLEKSEYFYRKSLDISIRINNNVRQSLIYDRLAKIALERSLLDSAIIYQEKAVEKAKNITDFKVIASVNLELGLVYNRVEKYDAAIKCLNYAKEIFKKSESTRKEPYHDIDYNLAEAYFGKGEFKKAYTYLKSAKEIIQDAQQIKNTERVEEVEAKYQAQKKKQEIILLKYQNQLIEQQKTNQGYVFLGSVGVISIAGIFFFLLYRTRQKTNNKLQALDRAKSVFFANISHEFRTPLTMISGPLQSLLQKEDLKEEDQLTFKMMYRNATRLLALVDQLLDISKIEASHLKLKISQNSIIPFIGMLVDGFTFKANQKKITYQVFNAFSEVETYFDADVLEKIIVNLISNAIKYTPENGSIVCDAFVKKGDLHFAVKNTGKTLSKQEIENIFQRFYQIDEHTQGAGIGLALVKELVALHKGLIEVESIPNEWTTFKVIIPITKNSFAANEFDATGEDAALKQETSTNGAITNAATVKYLTKRKESPILLVVDDNADIRTYISSLFKSNYKILEAKNGQEGVDVAIEKIPDIIISDIMMPVKNGIQLSNELKADERTSHIPIILLTAKAGDDNEIEGIKTGADDYVTKPFNEKLLSIRVEKLVESRKLLQLRYSQKIVLKPKDIAITSVDEQFLVRLQEILDHKLTASSFDVLSFSEAVGMSRMQLHRKLKALTGLSASEFIRAERLKLAAQLLKTAKSNVSEVGYRVGFNDHAYFSKCFKNRYDCTPTAYMQTPQEEK